MNGGIGSGGKRLKRFLACLLATALILTSFPGGLIEPQVVMAAAPPAAPPVVGTDPANGAVGVPLSVGAKVYFGVQIAPVGAAILREIHKQGVAEALYFDAGVLGDGDTSVSFALYNFEPDTTYFIKVPGGQIRDAVTSEVYDQSVSWSFRTQVVGPPPGVTGKNPVPSAADVSTNGVVPAVYFDVDVHSGGVSTVGWVYQGLDTTGPLVANGPLTFSGSTASFQNPLPPLLSATDYTVKIPGGQIRSAVTNTVQSSDIAWTFRTNGGGGGDPLTTANFGPPAGSFGVPTNGVVPAVYFNADVAGTAPNTVGWVYQGPGPFGPGDNPLFTSPLGFMDNRAFFQNPLNGLIPATDYTVQIDGGQIKHSVTNDVYSQPVQWSFRTIGEGGGGFGGTGGPMGFTVMGNSLMGMNPVPPNVEFIGIGLNLYTSQGPDAAMEKVYGVDATAVNDTNVTLWTGATQVDPANLEVFFNDGHGAIVISPLQPLAANTSYTLKVKGGSTGIRGYYLSNPGSPVYLSGDYTYDFITGAAVLDNMPPRVIGLDAKKDLGPGVIRVRYSESVQASAALDQANFTVQKKQADGSWGSALDLVTSQVYYDPMPKWTMIIGGGLNALALGDEVRATVSSQVYDMGGNPMETSGAANIVYGRVGEVFPDQMVSQDDFAKGTDMGQFAMMPVRAFPFNTMAGSTSAWMFQFPVKSQLAIGDEVVLEFPANYGLTGAGIHAEAPPNADINGPGFGQPVLDSVAGVTYNTINRTLTVKIAGSATQTTDYLMFVLTGIQNAQSNGPQTPVKITTQKVVSGTDQVIETINAEPFSLTGAGGTPNTLNVDVQSGGSPVEGVTVYLVSPTTGETSANSNASGVASFANLPDGYYFIWTDPTITAGPNTYLGDPMPRQIQLSGGATLTHSLTIQPAASLPTVTVNITGPAGKDAEIFAGSPMGFVNKEITFTGAAQSFELKVKPGRYMVGVGPRMPKSTNFGPPPMPDWIPPMPKEINVSGNMAVNFGTISSADKVLTVYVRDELGNGIPNAGVWAYDPNGNSHGAGGQTDASGKASLKMMGGLYTVGINVPGMPPVPEQQVKVEAANTSVTFVMAKPSQTISGTVKKGTLPVSGAAVFAYQVDNSGNPMPGHSGAMTSSTGSFTLFVNTNTRWVIGAFIPGFGQVAYDGAVDGSADGVVEVGVNNLTGVNIAANTANTGTVGGMVSVGGSPVQGAGVWAEPLSEQAMGNGSMTGQDGSYILSLTPGSYRLHAWLPEAGELSPVDITVASGGSLTRNFSLNSVVLSVYFNALGEMPNEVFVRAHNDEGRGNEIRVKSDSPITNPVQLKLPQSAVPYKVSAFIPGFGRLSEQTVTLNGPASVTFNLESSYGFDVDVRETGGPLLSGAAVTLTEKVYGASVTKPTGSGGLPARFNLRAGTYILTVKASGYLASQPVEVAIVNQNVIWPTIELATAASGQTISGTIYRNNQPVTGEAFVWATTAQGDWAGTAAGASGNFSLKVKNGTWTIEARSDGYEILPADKQVVSVSGSNVSGVRIDLNPKPNFTVKPPTTKNITPASGGTVDDPSSKAKVIIPANALGSSNNAGQVTVKQTSSVPSTSQAKPLGGIGTEIKALDNNGQAMTTLNDDVQVQVYYGDKIAGMSQAAIDQLQLGYWDTATETWVTIPSTNDKVNGLLVGKVNHFTIFAPIQPTGAGAPATPTGLSATAASSSQINVNWNTVSGATGYNLYRSTSSGGTFSKINSSAITGTSLSDTGLSASTAYYYKITAVNSGGESAASSEVTATTQAAADTTAPSWASGALTASSVTQTGLTLTWSGASDSVGVTQYRIYQGATLLATQAGTTYNVTGLTAGTSYTFSVQAGDAAGNWSNNGPTTSATTTAASSGGGGGGGTTATTTAATTATDPVISGNQADVSNSVTNEKATNSDGSTTATSTVTGDAVDKALATASVKEVTVTVKESATEQVASVPADSFTKMAEKKADLVVKTDKANLTIPAEVVKVADLAKQLGVSSSQVKIEIKVKEVAVAQAGELTGKAAQTDAALKPVAKVLSFTLEASASGKTVSISSFGGKVVKGEFPYTAEDVKNVKNPNQLNVYKYDEVKGQWIYVRSRPDPNGNKVVFYTSTFSNYSLMEHRKSFSDIAGHWAKEDVELMAGKYVVTGEPSGSFAPERGVTRAEFAAMLVRAAGLSPYTGNDGQFKDVAPAAWYFGVVEAAARAGLINGYGGGKFGPNDPVTREQVAAMVVRALKMEKKGAALTAEQTAALLGTFDDQTKVSSWAISDLAAAVNEKIVAGKTAKTLEPKAGASRAEAAVMIARYWKK